MSHTTTNANLNTRNIINNVQQIRYKYKFIKSVKYYDNINNTGKSILLIGEVHQQFEENFNNFLDYFLKDLIQKNEKLGSCLDFFIEHMIFDFRKNEFSSPIHLNVGRLIEKLNVLREKGKNGFRVHYTDLRVVSSQKNFKSFNYFMLFLHKSFFHRGTLSPNVWYEIYEVFRHYQVFLYICGVGPLSVRITGKILYQNLLQKLCSKYDRSNLNFFDFIKNLYRLENYDQDINNNIIRKQLMQVDENYFHETDLFDFIQEKYAIFKSYTIEMFFFHIGILYIDVYTICRMFRRFNYNKNSIHSRCDSDANNLKNIIVYGGSLHKENIDYFIQSYILNNSLSLTFDYFNFNKKIQELSAQET